MGRAKHGPRVMIVDDCLVATKVLGRLLERSGYQVCLENDPAKAHFGALKFQPHLVILDVCMPWKDGYEVAADFAEDEMLRDIPLIMISAYPQENDEETRHPILRKPFSIEELLAMIKNGLRKVVYSGNRVESVL